MSNLEHEDPLWLITMEEEGEGKIYHLFSGCAKITKLSYTGRNGGFYFNLLDMPKFTQLSNIGRNGDFNLVDVPKHRMRQN